MNEPSEQELLKQAASIFGRKGGSVKSKAKSDAAKARNAIRWAGHERKPRVTNPVCSHDTCMRRTAHESGLCKQHRGVQ